VKPFQLSHPADAELTDAIRWYEQQRPGLGAELFDAISETIDLIRTYPDIGAPRATRLPSRQLRVNRFPYHIVDRIREHDIYGVAVAHTSRQPEYWKGRL